MQDYRTVRVALVGSANSGKSSLARLLAKESFISSYDSTIGVDIKFIYFHELQIKVILWDLAGGERFERITTPMICSSDILILCFDTENNFRKVKYIYEKIGLKKKIILAETKFDLHKNKNREYDLLCLDFSEKNNCDYVKTSSFTGYGKKEIVNSLVKLFPVEHTSNYVIVKNDIQENNIERCVIL